MNDNYEKIEQIKFYIKKLKREGVENSLTPILYEAIDLFYKDVSEKSIVKNYEGLILFKCPNCHKQLHNRFEKHCPNCGKEIDWDVECLKINTCK